MADAVVKTCDMQVGRGKNIKAHGVSVESGEATKFRIEGVEYAADLCDEHKKDLLKAVKPFMDVAKRVGSTAPKNARGRAVMRAKGGVVFTTKDVRNWLLEQGREGIPATGRIPNALIDEYKAAHNV